MLPVPRHRETVQPGTPTDGDVDTQLLEIFFDRMPMGIAVFDRDSRLVRCSKSWSGFFVSYLGVPEDYVAPGRSIFELIPDNEEALAPLLEGVLAGKVVRQQAHRLQKGDLVTFWDVVFAPTFRDGEVVGFVDVVTDATERRLAYEALETRVATLARLASAMTVDQPLDDTLLQATAAVTEATGAVAGALLLQPDAGPATRSDSLGSPLVVSTGLPAGYGDAVSASWALGVDSPQARAFRTQQLAVVRGAASNARADPAYAPLHEHLDGSWEDLVVVPLDALGRSLGCLTAYYPAGYDVEDELPVLQAVADLAATALENARLYGEAEQHAAIAERQRLSRELHDSVSQALFSMTLHARTAQRLLDRLELPDTRPGAAQLADQLAELCELSTGALAEMRALIFELRPGALAEEGLAAALTRQAQALTAREGLPITVTAPTERVLLDPAVEEHLYRIALEALHNTVKHARAETATVGISLDARPAELVLTVADDGVGFDTALPHPGHLGQRTMHDRAAAIGARLTVRSQPGAGTTVQVRVPLAAAGPA